MDLSGKIALVTGAASGIGAATVDRLEQAGATVIGADLDAKGSCLAVDVAGEDSVAALFEQVVQRDGSLDILVCAAGTTCRRGVVETTLADWTRVIGVNLTGTFLCCRAAIPLMVAGGGGAIVTIGSDVAQRTPRRLAAYGTTKYAVVQLTKCIALDYGAEGIRANCVCPGPTDTPLIRRGYGDEAEVRKAEARAAALTIEGRLGRPEEIARVIAFVASDEASFMNGAIVPVDGGATVG